VEADGKQPAGQVLFGHPPGSKRARVRSGKLAAPLLRHRAGDPTFGNIGTFYMRIQRWWFTVPLRLRSILRGAQIDRELDEELQFHLEHKIEEGIANGLSPQEARDAALRAMGGLTQRKEQMRDLRRVRWLTDFFDDVRYAIRSLRRASGFTAFVVVTLALGIGMSSATYSMVDGLILKPYPV